MGSLGTYLRGLRSAKDVSLDEVTRATRVGRAHLEALEAEDLASLPAPVFVKGFIRAYCEFLQADPAQALAHYRALIGDRAHAASAGHMEPRAAGIGRGPVFVSVILLVVLGTALFALNSGRNSSSRAPRTPASSAPAGGAAAPAVSTPAAPVAAVSTEPARRQPEPAASPAPAAPAAPITPAAAPVTTAGPPAQRLVVKALEPTWIRVQMDGSRSVEELLPAGATREWSADKRFVLTVGNAGGISLELNGRALPPIGASGAVIRELVLPADGG